MPAVQFVAGEDYLVADMVVKVVAYTNEIGAAQSVDINSLIWKGTDVTKYIYECQPDTWEYMKQEAMNQYNVIHANVTS